MPLLHRSVSHGEIPFGFFNIETDMILLNNYFFFAGDFAQNVIEIADRKPGESVRMDLSARNQAQTGLSGYILEENDIGNLMAAISGVYLSGFIGEVYGHFPFPHEPDKFKQNPSGYETRELVEGIIKRYAPLTKVEVFVDHQSQNIQIGGYIFDRAGFHSLLLYLWAGGYPRWKDDVRPGYILDMKESAVKSSHPVFEGIVFD